MQMRLKLSNSGEWFSKWCLYGRKRAPCSKLINQAKWSSRRCQVPICRSIYLPLYESTFSTTTISLLMAMSMSLSKGNSSRRSRRYKLETHSDRLSFSSSALRRLISSQSQHVNLPVSQKKAMKTLSGAFESKLRRRWYSSSNQYLSLKSWHRPSFFACTIRWIAWSIKKMPLFTLRQAPLILSTFY